MIGLEMLLLLGFQAVYGYVYLELSIVIAAFMAGMALGSWLIPRGGMRALAVTQLLAAAAPFVLLALFAAIGRAGSGTGVAASRIAFPALALASGMLGGYQFQVASGIFFQDSQAERRPGTLYALDLAGSCLAAVLWSVWLVPVFGFLRTAELSALASLAPAAMATLSASRTGPEG